MTTRSRLQRLEQQARAAAYRHLTPEGMTDEQLHDRLAELTGASPSFIAGLSDDALSAAIEVLRADLDGRPRPDVSHLAEDERLFVWRRWAWR